MAGKNPKILPHQVLLNLVQMAIWSFQMDLVKFNVDFFFFFTSFILTNDNFGLQIYNKVLLFWFNLQSIKDSTCKQHFN